MTTTGSIPQDARMEERDAIVKWLRSDSARFRRGGAGGLRRTEGWRVPCLACHHDEMCYGCLADAIEKGEHVGP